ncbi:MAG: hypothetical protein VKJ24_15175, partial [Synechococcales bacterium]|nr:hypothetical protein [Synechococcales bacterium]
MIKITEILLRSYLRRNPIHLRLERFNFLYRYAWLKNVLEELRPELFPDQPEEAIALPPEPVAPEEIPIALDPTTLRGKKIGGLHGIYQLDRFVAQRGRGLLFEGTHPASRKPVVIKVYEFVAHQTQQRDSLFKDPRFQDQEIWRRLQQFADQCWLTLPDGRINDFRVPRIQDAIQDSQPEAVGDRHFYRAYLVTDRNAGAPTLHQHLQQSGGQSVYLVRQAIGQLLQTLDFLHCQKFVFQSGQVQAGFIHGNLNLKTVLRQEEAGQVFYYLTDLLLWERLFTTPMQVALPSVQADSSDRIQQDLQAVGRIGWAMLTGQTELPTDWRKVAWSQQDGDLDQLLRRLLGLVAPFASAAEARQALLNLPPLYAKSVQFDRIEQQAATKKSRLIPQIHWLGILAALAILGGMAVWLLGRQTKVAQSRGEPVSCCLKEVKAVPVGTFRYATVDKGSWDYVLRQSHLLAWGQSLNGALQTAQPKLKLESQAVPSIDLALERVRSQQVDFAVVPLLQDLPTDLVAREIAHDGLAVVVPFSYAKRENGLPQRLQGQLNVAQVNRIFTAGVEESQDLRWSNVRSGLPDLPILRSISDNPEAVAVFESRIIRPRRLVDLMPAQDSFITFSPIRQEATIAMLRSVIEDFEQGDRTNNAAGRIAISTLSQIKGQCSVYPLAIASRRQEAAIQPWIMEDGKSITPDIDICDRKGEYKADAKLFRDRRYPLAYPIAVVYPKDNQRSAPGKKFAELLRTQEGQQLLSDAGLVPVEDRRSLKP